MPPRSGKESSFDDELTSPAPATFLLPLPPASALQADRERLERALSAARAANDAERAAALVEAAEPVETKADREAVQLEVGGPPDVSGDDEIALIAAMPEHIEVLAAAVVPAPGPDRAPDDAIVEPPPALPRAPKKSTPNEKFGILLIGLGALGLLCSVVLAVGALLVAIEVDVDATFAGAVSDLCDVLVGPLGGLFSFSGENAAARNDLFARGIGSMIYLAIGLFLPSVARRRDS